jgi:hypothetical protein
MLMDSVQPLSRSPSRYVYLSVHYAGLKQTVGGKGGGGRAGVEVRLTDTTSRLG